MNISNSIYNTLFISSLSLFVFYAADYFDVFPPNIIESKSVIDYELDDSEFLATKIRNSEYHVISNIRYDDYSSKHGQLPNSLKGTIIPVNFQLDEQGHLVITKSIKNLIEYFLSANSEESITIIINRIDEVIHKQLKEPALSEALDVVAQYLNYKEVLTTSETNLSDDQLIKGSQTNYQVMFEYRREIRQNNLSPEIYDAFYSIEDKSDNYTATILKINRDASLSDGDKRNKILEAETLLSEQQQSHKQAQRLQQQVHDEVQTARINGASPEEIFEIRSKAYDAATNERFAIADQNKAEWEDRYQKYVSDRDQISDTDGLSDADKTQEILMLKQAQFNEREQMRVSTLDRISANP